MSKTDFYLPDGNLVEKAAMFAIQAHAGQCRKAQGTPAFLHATEAASVAASLTSEPEIIAAVLLHDTVEDAGITSEIIRNTFGERVARLVSAETEDKREPLPPDFTWKIRKEESLRELAQTDDPAVRILWLSDKLSNMRAFYGQYLKCGDALWNGFNQKNPQAQAWYYRTIAASLSSLADTPAYQEYVSLMNRVFEHYPEIQSP